ncbi:MAG: F0F1 ATP synthase subunit B [Flavobacteriales bacterium]|jgi:F-type H+-transporting ATPase subunit b|nr:MAG: F0F1 ATP synthase subunit B [Flavobacteriales bacterium]|tara:strand:+ start:1366 stop:1860 length:495 start_codon:yes stop_codon:yes gene_type:complete
MDLVTPDIGLLVWTGISFGLLYLILKKFAWGPILGAVNEREQSIKNALEAADKAKEEMETLKADNEKILKEARAEKENLLKEAREIKSKLISDAEEEAKRKSKKMVDEAKTAIQNEKNSAMNELRNTVVDLSIGIAEKVISEELVDNDKQLKMIEDILEDSKLK